MPRPRRHRRLLWKAKSLRRHRNRMRRNSSGRHALPTSRAGQSSSAGCGGHGRGVAGTRAAGSCRRAIMLSRAATAYGGSRSAITGAAGISCASIAPTAMSFATRTASSRASAFICRGGPGDGLSGRLILFQAQCKAPSSTCARRSGTDYWRASVHPPKRHALRGLCGRTCGPRTGPIFGARSSGRSSSSAPPRR